MVISNKDIQVQYTQPAFLVVWGWFAEQIGLIEQMEKVPLKQKRYYHNSIPWLGRVSRVAT